MRLFAPLAVVLVALATGCPLSTDGAACASDGDCGDGVCTRIHVCASDVYALRVSWTIRGVPASASTCASATFSDLELTISDPSDGMSNTVAPVPCAAGSFFWDKLPTGYTAVTMTGRTANGVPTISNGDATGAGGMVTLDLIPR